MKDATKASEAEKAGSARGAQAVSRAIDILEAIAERPMLLGDLAERVGLPTQTCYRLARALSDRGLLATSGRTGFTLGPRLRELAAASEGQKPAR